MPELFFLASEVRRQRKPRLDLGSSLEALQRAAARFDATISDFRPWRTLDEQTGPLPAGPTAVAEVVQGKRIIDLIYRVEVA